MRVARVERLGRSLVGGGGEGGGGMEVVGVLSVGEGGEGRRQAGDRQCRSLLVW